jgi:putative methyltransferase (TIGR04325 family)
MASREIIQVIAKNTPVLRTFMKLRYDRTFKNNKGEQLYRGVFSTYDEAAASAPTAQIGYDHKEPALMYTWLMKELQNYDYPVLFWLNKILSQRVPCRVFDYGGHVGVKYYAYNRLLVTAPEWTVCDVPAVVLSGSQMAEDLDPDKKLKFTVNFDEVEGDHILLCLGSLQYVKESLAEKLGLLPQSARPRHIIVNTTPFVQEGEEAFWTLNSIGTAFCPYKVQCVESFVAEMKRVGYETLDTWENPGRRCRVPFQDRHADFRYLGMHFGACDPEQRSDA